VPVGTVRFEGRPEYLAVRISVEHPLPYLVRVDDRRITLVLYGGYSNTDWLRYGPADPFLRAARWEQVSSDRYELHIDLAERPWGYRARYDGGALQLDVRKPPRIDRERPLSGLAIAIDPGHPPGGATGPTRLAEADANLGVAYRLKRLLEREGARVLMPRTDRSPVRIYDRTDYAELMDADVLISIHNNALPDGVNPFVNHGTSVYYFQPHALELARRQTLESGDTVYDRAIATFSRKLGEALARSGDPAGADGVLREALDLTLPRSADRARMLLSLGRIASRRDRPRDAMRHFGQALELVAGVEPSVESHLQVAIGRIRRIEGDPHHAANAYRRALELFAELGASADTMARTRLELADALTAAGDHESAAHELTSVERESKVQGGTSLVARAVGMLGSIDELAGRARDAQVRYEEAASLAAEAGDAPGYRRWLSASKTLRASI